MNGGHVGFVFCAIGETKKKDGMWKAGCESLSVTVQVAYFSFHAYGIKLYAVR